MKVPRWYRAGPNQLRQIANPAFVSSNLGFEDRAGILRLAVPDLLHSVLKPCLQR